MTDSDYANRKLQDNVVSQSLNKTVEDVIPATRGLSIMSKRTVIPPSSSSVYYSFDQIGLDGVGIVLPQLSWEALTSLIRILISKLRSVTKQYRVALDGDNQEQRKAVIGFTVLALMMFVCGMCFPMLVCGFLGA